MPSIFDPNQTHIENEADALEDAAMWRRRKAEEYPEDDRNKRAAEVLAKLAVEVRQLAGTPLGREFGALLEETSDIPEEPWPSTSGLIATVDRYRSRVGFDSLPDSGEEYIRELMEIHTEALRDAEEVAREAEEVVREAEKVAREEMEELLRERKEHGPPH